MSCDETKPGPGRLHAEKILFHWCRRPNSGSEGDNFSFIPHCSGQNSGDCIRLAGKWNFYSQVVLRPRAGSAHLGISRRGTFLRVNKCGRGEFDPESKIFIKLSFLSKKLLFYRFLSTAHLHIPPQSVFLFATYSHPVRRYQSLIPGSAGTGEHRTKNPSREMNALSRRRQNFLLFCCISCLFR